MLRKLTIAALAVAAIGLLAPQAAQARGGGWHGGGGGWHGGGAWHGGGGWHGGGFWPGVAIGAGLAGAGYYGYPYYYYGTDYEGYGGCYVARKRVKTPSGWRVRSVDVCE